MFGVSAVTLSSRHWLAIVGKVWSWLFLCLLIITFSVSGEGFLSFFNLQNILTDMVFALLVALAQTFVIISGGFDLSVGYCMGIASVISALLIVALGKILPLPLVLLLAITAGLLAGTLPGLFNGLFIAFLSVPPFIVTLGMYGIVRGIGYVISGGFSVAISQDGIGNIGNNYFLYLVPDGRVSFFAPPPDLSLLLRREMVGVLQLQLFVGIIVVFFCYWILAQTRFGRHTYAIGGNREAALRAGIPVKRHTIYVYMLSAFISAIAGVLYVFRYSSGRGDAGDALLIGSVAAVAIGGASLSGGAGTIMGTLTGALIIAVIQNGLVIIGIDPFWQFIAVGIIIILAVFVDQARSRLGGWSSIGATQPRMGDSDG